MTPDDLLDITRFATLAPGPDLLVLGAVHGNETCGPVGMRRAITDIREGRITIARGSVTFLPIANPKAYRQGTREGDRNLNRDLAVRDAPQDNEDRLGNRLVPLLHAHDVLLDIHSFSAEGLPFCFAGGEQDHRGTADAVRSAAQEWDFATRLGPSLVIHGWLEGYGRHLAAREAHGFPVPSAAEGIGTTETMRAGGGYGVTIECGQHEDPAGAEVAHEAILRALAILGIVEGEEAPVTATEAIRIVDSLLCEREGDRIEPGFKTGDPVAAGKVIARRADGHEVFASQDGFVIFPNPNATPGQQLCYVGIASDRLTAPVMSLSP